MRALNDLVIRGPHTDLVPLLQSCRVNNTRERKKTMPLIDHFHPPVLTTHSWESFHARWAVAICDRLNALLPSDRYLAEVQVTLGARIEADLAEFELEHPPSSHNSGNGGVAVETWAPPVATRSIPFSFPDDIEVSVHDLREGKTLVGVVELVSPANKDRPEHRLAFTAKSLAYLHRGIGLLVVDIVTSRTANFHRLLLERLGEDGTADPPSASNLYAVAYRPAQREHSSQLDLWSVSLQLNQPLPELPLALRGSFFVPIDLEATYMEARQHQHL
jgi:hypothetical protein